MTFCSLTIYNDNPRPIRFNTNPCPHYRTRPYTELWKVSLEHLRRMWHTDKGRLLLGTPGPVPLWTCIRSSCWEQSFFPILSLFSLIMHFEHPSALSRLSDTLLVMWHKKKRLHKLMINKRPEWALHCQPEQFVECLYVVCSSFSKDRGCVTKYFNTSKKDFLEGPYRKFKRLLRLYYNYGQCSCICLSNVGQRSLSR